MIKEKIKKTSVCAQSRVHFLRNESDVRKWARRFFFGSSVIFLCSISFYLFSVNSLAAKGNEVRSVEHTIGQVREDYQKMQIREAELRSLYQIKETAGGLERIEPAEVSYVQEKGSVALRR